MRGAAEAAASDLHGTPPAPRESMLSRLDLGRAIAVVGRRCPTGGPVPAADLDLLGAGCIAIASPPLRMDGWSSLALVPPANGPLRGALLQELTAAAIRRATSGTNCSHAVTGGEFVLAKPCVAITPTVVDCSACAAWPELESGCCYSCGNGTEVAVLIGRPGVAVLLEYCEHCAASALGLSLDALAWSSLE